MDSIEMGSKIMDTVTGYRGTVTGIAKWAHNRPDSAYVESLHDGQVVEGWIDIVRLRVVESVGYDDD